MLAAGPRGEKDILPVTGGGQDVTDQGERAGPADEPVACAGFPARTRSKAPSLRGALGQGRPAGRAAPVPGDDVGDASPHNPPLSSRITRASSGGSSEKGTCPQPRRLTPETLTMLHLG